MALARMRLVSLRLDDAFIISVLGSGKLALKTEVHLRPVLRFGAPAP